MNEGTIRRVESRSTRVREREVRGARTSDSSIVTDAAFEELGVEVCNTDGRMHGPPATRNGNSMDLSLLKDVHRTGWDLFAPYY